MEKLTEEEITELTITEKEIKAIIVEHDHSNRPYIAAILTHFCRYAAREWNATDMDPNVIKEYLLSVEKL